MVARVTALHPERRDRVRVELDGAPWRTLPAAAVVSARLAVGTDLDRARARELAQAIRRAEALGAATRALARRDRSVVGLADYLARRGVGRKERAEAVDRLADIGYLDDERFAFGRARSLAERGYGDDAVRFELEREGVAADRIDTAVAGLAAERARALSVLRGSRSALAGIRKLAAKGFSADSIEAAAAEARIDLGSD
jgi:SOS response regulatory protein OraA/RecX